MRWNRLNEFEIFNEFGMFNEFEMTGITLKKVLRNFMRTCKTLSRIPYINIEYKSKISQFNYTDNFVTRTMNFLAVVKLPYFIMVSTLEKRSGDKSSHR